MLCKAFDLLLKRYVISYQNKHHYKTNNAFIVLTFYLYTNMYLYHLEFKIRSHRKHDILYFCTIYNVFKGFGSLASRLFAKHQYGFINVVLYIDNK